MRNMDNTLDGQAGSWDELYSHVIQVNEDM